MTARLDKDRLATYLQVILLALAASVIYSPPYLRQIFKTSMLDAFAIDDVQLGNLSSMYAFCSMISYLPGGWIADRVAPKTLLVFALFATAATFVWLATLPGYAGLLTIYGLWGIIGVGVVWAAMLRHVRLLARGDEQGRMFGVLEGSRGFFEAVITTIGAFIFSLFAARRLGMVNVIIMYAVLATAIGFLLLFTRSMSHAGGSDTGDRIRLTDLLEIVRQPTVWLLCIILSAVFHLFWGTIEFPSFAETGGFGMTVTAAIALGTTKMWLRPVGGALGGVIGDRTGNARLMMWLFALGIASCCWLWLMPATPGMAWTLWIFIFPFGLLAYAARGIFWALLYDCPLPTRALGTAIGFVSIVGYTPDLYVPQVSAYLTTTFGKGPGYQLFYAYIAGVSGVGLMAAWALYRKTHRA